VLTLNVLNHQNHTLKKGGTRKMKKGDLKEKEETENGESQIKVSEKVKEQKPFEFLINAVLAIEKLRVAAQVRQSHLKLQGRSDKETDDLLEEMRKLEDYADGRVASLIQEHPAYPWFSRVKGVGKENIGKVVGLVDINKADTPSSLWKFAGYSVENGVAPKRVKGGGKLAYNSRLRSMCWRLGSSLIKYDGCFRGLYDKEKKAYQERFAKDRIKIVPATQLPKDKNGKRYEPPDLISEGHVHAMALRKMIKIFLSCLWVVWREAEGLSTRPPYPIEKLGHTTLINPWDMVDKPAPRPRIKKAA
jgi:hypothetical protein